MVRRLNRQHCSLAVMTISPSTSFLPLPERIAQSVGSANDQRVFSRAVRILSEQNVFGADNVLTVSIDPATKRPVVRIISRTTRELVMQLPVEAVLRLYAQFKQGGRLSFQDLNTPYY